MEEMGTRQYEITSSYDFDGEKERNDGGFRVMYESVGASKSSGMAIAVHTRTTSGRYRGWSRTFQSSEVAYGISDTPILSPRIIMAVE